MKNRWPRWSLAGDHRVSSRSVIAKREGYDHQGQRVFGRGVRPRMDNSDHRGQRVYEGSALAVLYSLIHTLNNSVRMLNTWLYFLGPINDTETSVIVCSNDFPNCVENKTIAYEKCDNGQYIFKLKSIEYCGAYCIGTSIRSLRLLLHFKWRDKLCKCIV